MLAVILIPSAERTPVRPVYGLAASLTELAPLWPALLSDVTTEFGNRMKKSANRSHEYAL